MTLTVQTMIDTTNEEIWTRTDLRAVAAELHDSPRALSLPSWNTWGWTAAWSAGGLPVQLRCPLLPRGADPPDDGRRLSARNRLAPPRVARGQRVGPSQRVAGASTSSTLDARDSAAV